MIARMAWRNLWRNRRRTLITLGSIVFGLFLSLIFTALGHGSWGKIIDSSARMNSGHVTIEPKGYRDAPSTDIFLPDATGLAARAAKLPGIVGTNVRILGTVMASTASGSAGTGLYGIDPIAEKGILPVLSHLKAGEPLSGPSGNEVLIGARLAEQLDLKVRSKLVITATDKNGEVVSGLLRVRGIFEMGVPDIDRTLIVVPINWARSLLGYGGAGATQVAVLLKDRRDTDSTAAGLEGIAREQGGISLPWYKTNPELSATLTMDNESNYIMQVIIFILIGAGILNTVLMGVLERFHELGVMRAVGMSPLRLWRLVMIECLWMAFFGLVSGVAFTAPIYAYLHDKGLDLSGLLKQKATVGNVVFDPTYTAELYPETVAIILGLVFLLIMAAGIYPAVVAARIKPLNAIRQI